MAVVLWPAARQHQAASQRAHDGDSWRSTAHLRAPAPILCVNLNGPVCVTAMEVEVGSWNHLLLVQRESRMFDMCTVTPSIDGSGIAVTWQ